jgi:hypothetical protein
MVPLARPDEAIVADSEAKPAVKTYTFVAPAGGVGDLHISESKTISEAKAHFDMYSQQGEAELDHLLDRVQAEAGRQRVAARELLLSLVAAS